MTEIRFHGRGGQGAVIASEIFASALFKEGKYVQTFPEFGVERRGAPVQAFLRFDEKPIMLRCKVYTPDHVIILDSVLLKTQDVTMGLRPGGWILLNSDKEPREFSFPNFRVATIDATGVAIKYKLGPKTAPIVNTAVLGAFIRVSEIVRLDNIYKSIPEYVPVKIEDNIKATGEAYEMVRF
ncbi:MAG: 2-oxoacid:acceptor oxidoreductase family protein [candidate division WOR-3 bacterium]|nr:2-oxoacid:acceptor oxidoreductase family protein [candidate division WOR-3 bacterium]MDH5683740.1 2-oxoacid:acceptor oxidoreductase family protein [candidate division WOR-3 bacterium]